MGPAQGHGKDAPSRHYCKSGWTYGPVLSLFGDGPAPCVRRIKPDSTLDETWTPDLTTWTGGRPVHTFR